MRTDSGQVFRLEDYRPGDYLIPQTELLFRLDPQETVVTATLTLKRRDGAPADAPLLLDGDGLVLESLLLDGSPVPADTYDVTPERLEIRNLPESGSFELQIVTKLSHMANKALMGLYQSSGVYCTQC